MGRGGRKGGGEGGGLPPDHWTHTDPDRELWTPSQRAQAQQVPSRVVWEAMYGIGVINRSHDKSSEDVAPPEILPNDAMREILSPGQVESVMKTINEVHNFIVEKDGISMELKGDYQMVADLVPDFDQMGVPGGDPRFPSQVKYSPEETLTILSYLANDFGPEDGAAGGGHSLAQSMLLSLGMEDDGEIDSALMVLGWLTADSKESS